MSYIVLARKLRPTCFDDLIGQETIATILRNSLLKDRVAHAFLFTGSRGVGKTSCARILAKALNCLNPKQADPCNVCENCREIDKDATPDVYEIDAASNRKIEDIRELRENVKYAPSRCRYKVYIIDEAHMLTPESFNALLKTLEEPPLHVKFILATTDPHKIPQTIIARCQRYDFIRIPLQKMTDYLETVTQQEGIQFPRSALELVARHAVGGMRDALMAIDQVISYTGTSATELQVSQILGIIDARSRFQFLEAILHKNPNHAIQYFHQLQTHGYEFQNILAELLDSIKTLALVQTLGIDRQLFQDIPTHELQEFQSLSKLATADELQQIFNLLIELEERMKRSTHAQICFEMALLQITQVQSLIHLPQLIQQLQAVREDLPAPSEVSPLEEKKNPFYADEPSYNPSDTNESPVVRSQDTLQVASSSYLSFGTNTIQNSDESVSDLNASNPANVSSESQPPSNTWIQFVNQIQNFSEQLGILIKHAVPLKMNSEEIHFAFKHSAFLEFWSDEKKQLLEHAITQIFTNPIRVHCADQVVDSSIQTFLERQDQLRTDEKKNKQKAIEADPQVQTILRTFPHSKIINIELESLSFTSL